MSVTRDDQYKAQYQTSKNAGNLDINPTSDEDKRQEKRTLNWLTDHDYGILFTDYKKIQEEIDKDKLDIKYVLIISDLSNADPAYVDAARKFYPVIGSFIDYVNNKAKKIVADAKQKQGDKTDGDSLLEDYMTAFTRPGQPPFQSGLKYIDTQQKVFDIYQSTIRLNTPPVDPELWECRIGASKFMVPPININVTQSFRVSSLTSGAIRQAASPKFNSGHSETVIDMTLYFPNTESLWGYEGTGDFNPDFSSTGLPDDQVDTYLSSLRGLITEFKYAPFLPIRNDYLNRTYGITGVVMSNMSISTLEGFPFCVVVNLQLLKFNHKAYLPMISDFNSAVHWGKLRSYLGFASQRMQAAVSKGFLTENNSTNTATQNQDAAAAAGLFGGQTLANTDPLHSVVGYEFTESTNFNKTTEFEDGKNLDFYYPISTPDRVFAPDMSDFRAPGEDSTIGDRSKNPIELFLGFLGLDVNTNYKSAYAAASASQYSKTVLARQFSNPYIILANWLKEENVALEQMSPGKLNDYVQFEYQKAQDAGKPLTDEQKTSIKADIDQTWLEYLLNNYKNSPYFQAYFQSAEYQNGHFLISEWEVPMNKAFIDWTQVTINGVSVNLANNIARLQIQMQDEPVHQHIGAQDATLSVSMTVIGEDNLIRLRKLFEHINGLARLEHSHGVLGYLGIKNVLTGLCGIKYVLPLSFDTKSMPGYPHIYSVNLSMVDFDVFQQKRETLDSSQQKELVEAFSKRNPFLRIKQLWGQFNAYPDFPLEVKDTNGKTAGHLDPDYYFRSFQNIEDDILYGVRRQVTVDPVGAALAAATATTDEARKAAQDALAQADKESFSYKSGLAYDYYKYDQQPSGFSKLTPNYNHTVTTHFPQLSKDSTIPIIKQNKDGISAGTVEPSNVQEAMSMVNGVLMDDSPDQALQKPFLPTAKTQPFAAYGAPFADGSFDPSKQFELMMVDSQYRNNSGRMIRAFPTYMLWLIDEGGHFAGVKLFDNFYGLQSIMDFSVVSSEDILGDTLVLRVSNLYSKLTSRFRPADPKDPGYVDPTSDSNPDITQPEQIGIPDLLLNTERNTKSGTSSYILEIADIRLKPGVRVHLRAGYSANPNTLQTIFNGTITEVEQGDIVTITAQSDAIELSPMINSSNKSGSSGKIDGSYSNLFMSEPRDLMVRLLSMGSSSFKEAFANATNGMIFSENRFGIRHFGQILYEPLSDGEQKSLDSRNAVIKQKLDQILHSTSAGSVAGAAVDTVAEVDTKGGGVSVRSPMIMIMQNMATNFLNKRDYELFKRNIYPGNGLGVAQFLGGDLGDGGVMLAAGASTVRKNAPSALSSSQDQEIYATEQLKTLAADDNARQLAENANHDGSATQANINADAFGDGYSTRASHPFLRAMHVLNPEADDDIKGFDEISFRAQTYLKSVWDLFQTCAALLPNYVVAVRPFEDRSTVFYGKPHWLYTSGVVPLTTGIPTDDKGNSLGAKWEGPDKQFEDLLRQASEASNPLADLEKQQTFEAKLSNVDPNKDVSGNAWVSGDVANLPLTNAEGKQLIPERKGKVVIEMHLPTTGEHIQDPALPSEQRFPFYMDRVGGPRGGDGKTGGFSTNEATGTVLGEDPNLEGSPTAFTPMSPEDEQYYIDMRWPKKDDGTFPRDWVGIKVLVFNENTGKACICTPGDWGPSGTTQFVAGLSPDTMLALGSKTGDANHWFGLVSKTIPVGPVAAAANIGLNNPPQGPAQTTGQGAVPNIPGVNLTGVTDKNTITWLTNYGTDKEFKGSGYRSGGKGLSAVDYYNNFGAQDKDVPVWVDPQSNLFQSNVDQNVGDLARQLYDKSYAKDQNAPSTLIGNSKGRTLADAESIWDQFRADFKDYNPVKDTYTKITNNDSYVHGKWDKDYLQWISDFRKFLWEDPYRRAWVVIVTSLKTDATQLPEVSGTAGTALDAIGGGLGVGNLLSKGVDIDIPFGSSSGKWSFGKVEQLWAQYVTARKDGLVSGQYDTNVLIQWMHGHETPGNDIDSKIGKAIDEAKGVYDDTLGKLFSAVGAGLSGLVTVFRLSMMQLGQSLTEVGNMQQQANALNKVFNDSIYYAAGEQGSITRLADNPFTREYGEPVVEIREPFQRMHYIDSFQHILSNGLTENLDNVATVVTASSDGKYPVTVYLDKGAPSDRQQETTIETGIFWDNAKGSGLGALTHPFFHPIETIRGIAKIAGGSSDEILSKRIGLSHLRENIKDIYKGEIIILGDADIRPHDLVFLGDVYERTYGMFEVEQVIHHFTPDMGFVTSITPNAIVTVNDPARWSMISWIRSWWGVKHIRDFTRHKMELADDDSGKIFTTGGVSIKELAQSLEIPLKGDLQYTQGSSALVRDLAASASVGLLQAANNNNGAPGGAGLLPALAVAGAGVAAPVIGAGLGAAAGFPVGGFGAIPGAIAGFAGGSALVDLGWSAWDWVRDNLLDQHGCYIQYLTKDGQALDAGLSYTSGVAVGRTHSITLLPNLFGIQIPTIIDGHERITADDLLKSLGWTEIESQSLVKDASWWVSQVNTQVLKLSGKSPDTLDFGQPPEVRLVEVLRVIDGDTIVTTDQEHIRFAGINAPELTYKDDPNTPYTLEKLSIMSRNELARIAGEDLNLVVTTGEDKNQLITAILAFTHDDSTINDETLTNLNSANAIASYLYVKKRILDDLKDQYGKATVVLRIDPTHPVDSASGGTRTLATIFADVSEQFQGSSEEREAELMRIASQWPLIEWDSYMDDSRPYTINWDLVIHGFAFVYLTNLAFNDTSRGAEFQKG